MNTLHMVEFHLDSRALIRFLHAQGLNAPRQSPDFGYGVHAWLKAALGDLAPKPWRLLADRRRPPRVLSYSSMPAIALAERLSDFAEPMVQAVCGADGIASKPLPSWSRDRRLGIEVLCCPVGRKARQKVEKDIFLIHADRHPDEPLDRGAIYADWLRERLEREGAASVERLQLAAFRRIRMQRKEQSEAGERAIRLSDRPEARLTGILSVGDPLVFAQLLARGIGRHRAFGYGMLLLRPPGPNP